MATYYRLKLLLDPDEDRAYREKRICVEFDLLRLTYLFNMCVGSENVVTNFSHLETVLFGGDIEVGEKRGGGKDEAATARGSIPDEEMNKVRKTWVPFAKQALRYIFAWGFVPVSTNRSRRVPEVRGILDTAQSFGFSYDPDTCDKEYYLRVGAGQHRMRPQQQYGNRFVGASVAAAEEARWSDFSAAGIHTAGQMGDKMRRFMAGTFIVEVYAPHMNGTLGCNIQALSRGDSMLNMHLVTNAATVIHNAIPPPITEPVDSKSSVDGVISNHLAAWQLDDRRVADRDSAERDAQVKEAFNRASLQSQEQESFIRALGLLGNGPQLIQQDPVTGGDAYGAAEFGSLFGRHIDIPHGYKYVGHAPPGQESTAFVDLMRMHSQRCSAIMGIPESVVGITSSDGRVSTDYAVMATYQKAIRSYLDIVTSMLSIVAWEIYGDVNAQEAMNAVSEAVDAYGEEGWQDKVDPRNYSLDVRLTSTLPPHTAVSFYERGVFTHLQFCKQLAAIFNLPIESFAPQHIDPNTGLAVMEVREKDLRDQFRLMDRQAGLTIAATQAAADAAPPPTAAGGDGARGGKGGGTGPKPKQIGAIPGARKMKHPDEYLRRLTPGKPPPVKKQKIADYVRPAEVESNK